MNEFEEYKDNDGLFIYDYSIRKPEIAKIRVFLLSEFCKHNFSFCCKTVNTYLLKYNKNKDKHLLMYDYLNKSNIIHSKPDKIEYIHINSVLDYSNKRKKYPDVNILLFTDGSYKLFKDIEKHEKHEPRIFFVCISCEPPNIKKKNLTQIESFYNRIDLMLAWEEDVLKKCKNSRFFSNLTTTISEDLLEVYPKTHTVSMILSHKKATGNHLLRHQIYNNLINENIVDFYGLGTPHPVEFKIDAFKKYMFSIVVINTDLNFCMTEALYDCFVTGTIPIFKGFPEIGMLFDINGIIQFHDYDDLLKILPTLNIDLYLSKMDSIKRNFNKFKEYLKIDDQIAYRIVDGLGLSDPNTKSNF